GKRIVLCHGVFDLLHIGHVRHFEQARKLGDVLVVTLTPDRFVNKGVGWPTAVETIRLLRPHVFAKGSEFRGLDDTIGHVSKEAEAIREVGGEMAFTEDLVYSSSGLINQY